VLERFVWWDSLHFVRIAEVGYLPPGLPCCDQAFFPGYPLLIRLVMPVVGGSAPVAALLVTALAGVAAAVAVWHLVRDQVGPRAATTAVVLMAVAPYGVFFTAAYTETLFLALAAGAWWAAGRRRWWLAGLLCAGAVSVRVNGLFLGSSSCTSASCGPVATDVHASTHSPWWRRWSSCSPGWATSPTSPGR
jgi:Gpi18-like mannosyltransferase